MPVGSPIGEAYQEADEAESPDDPLEDEPPDEPDASPPSDDAYTDCCFLLSFVCLGHEATVPSRHFPLQK